MGRKTINQISHVLTSLIGGVTFLGFLMTTSRSMEDFKEDDKKQATHRITQTHPSALDKLFCFGSSDHHPSNFIRSKLVGFLSVDDKAQMRLVAKRYRDFIDLSFFGAVHDTSFAITPFSSEISRGTVGDNILALLRTAQRRVIIASDKCTNEEFLDDLLTLRGHEDQGIEIRIVTGEDRQTAKTLSNPKYEGRFAYQSIASDRGRGKMHNKFIIVDDRLVITGSPNLTFAAYNYNVESFVAIHHRFVASLYFRYYQYIVCGKDKYDQTQDEYRRVRKMMNIFNGAPDNLIQVCLAPILDIKTFIIREINAAEIIDINMFLVSRASEPDNDIVHNLLTAGRRGAEITMKVDGAQYGTQAYMRTALNPFKDLGKSVYTVSKNSQRIRTRTKSIETKPQFHDKLVLIRQTDGSKKVFIGSAGFTDNVQDNLNLENMVLLRVPGIYDMLLTHFTSIDGSRGNLVVTKL